MLAEKALTQTICTVLQLHRGDIMRQLLKAQTLLMQDRQYVCLARAELTERAYF